MKQRLLAFAIIVLLTLISLSASEHRDLNAGLPVVKSDYQRCVTVRNRPLRPQPRMGGRGPVSEIA